MLAKIPNHPISAGIVTLSEVANRIEYESVPIENRICANAKFWFFVFIILRPNSVKDCFSAPLLAEYCLAILSNPQYFFSL